MIKIDKKLKITLCVVGVLIVSIFVWYFVSNRVHDNGTRIDTIRTELDKAEGYNKSITEHTTNIESGIWRSEESINNSIDRIESVQIRNREIEAGLDELARINTESESIIEAVRKRNQEGNQ